MLPLYPRLINRTGVYLEVASIRGNTVLSIPGVPGLSSVSRVHRGVKSHVHRGVKSHVHRGVKSHVLSIPTITQHTVTTTKYIASHISNHHTLTTSHPHNYHTVTTITISQQSKLLYKLLITEAYKNDLLVFIMTRYSDLSVIIDIS